MNRQELVQSERENLYHGTAVVHLDHIEFRSAEADRNDSKVDHLLGVFEAEGCRNLERKHSITAKIPAHILDQSLQASGLEPEDIRNRQGRPHRLHLPSQVRIQALNGRRRIEAARTYFKEHTDLLWVVDLYTDGLREETEREFSEEYQNESQYTYGEIVYQIWRYQNDRNDDDADRWRARLSVPKQKDHARLTKYPEIYKILCEILECPGLRHALRLYLTRTCSTLGASQEVLHYLELILKTWWEICGGRRYLFHKITKRDVKLLQGRAPGLCYADRRFIQDSVDNDECFSSISDVDEKDFIVANVMAIDIRIPSLKTLFDDIQPFETWITPIRKLLSLPEGTIIFEGLAGRFDNPKDKSQLIQTEQTQLKAYLVDENDQLIIASLQLLLLAIRDGVSLTGDKLRTDRGDSNLGGIKPCPYAWRSFAQLASNIGFSSPGIDEHLQPVTERHTCPDFPICSGRKSQIEITMALPGEEVRRRSGRLYQDAYLHIRQSFFLPLLVSMHKNPNENVTAAFTVYSQLHAFFGSRITDLGGLQLATGHSEVTIDKPHCPNTSSIPAVTIPRPELVEDSQKTIEELRTHSQELQCQLYASNQSIDKLRSLLLASEKEKMSLRADRSKAIRHVSARPTVLGSSAQQEQLKEAPTSVVYLEQNSNLIQQRHYVSGSSQTDMDFRQMHAEENKYSRLQQAWAQLKAEKTALELNHFNQQQEAKETITRLEQRAYEMQQLIMSREQSYSEMQQAWTQLEAQKTAPDSNHLSQLEAAQSTIALLEQRLMEMRPQNYTSQVSQTDIDSSRMMSGEQSYSDMEQAYAQLKDQIKALELNHLSQLEAAQSTIARLEQCLKEVQARNYNSQCSQTDIDSSLMLSREHNYLELEQTCSRLTAEKQEFVSKQEDLVKTNLQLEEKSQNLVGEIKKLHDKVATLEEQLRESKMMILVLRSESETAIHNWNREKAKLEGQAKIQEKTLIDQLHVKESEMAEESAYGKAQLEKVGKLEKHVERQEAQLEKLKQEVSNACDAAESRRVELEKANGELKVAKAREEQRKAVYEKQIDRLKSAKTDVISSQQNRILKLEKDLTTKTKQLTDVELQLSQVKKTLDGLAQTKLSEAEHAQNEIQRLQMALEEEKQSHNIEKSRNIRYENVLKDVEDLEEIDEGRRRKKPRELSITESKVTNRNLIFCVKTFINPPGHDNNEDGQPVSVDRQQLEELLKDSMGKGYTITLKGRRRGLDLKQALRFADNGIANTFVISKQPWRRPQAQAKNSA